MLETTAELSYAKSALKSGEVKDMLMKLPALLMETSDKTLIKEEATIIGEYSKISARKNESSRRDNSSSISRMQARNQRFLLNNSAVSSVRGVPSSHNGSLGFNGRLENDTTLFRQESSGSEVMEFHNLTKSNRDASLNGLSAAANLPKKHAQVTNRTAFLIRRLLNDQSLAELKKAKTNISTLRT